MRRSRQIASGGKRIVSESLQVPFESLMNTFTQIELLGNREAVVEGCKGILEYDENIIRLSINKLEVKFYGNDLSIRNLNSENIVINGNIHNIEFST